MGDIRYDYGSDERIKGVRMLLGGLSRLPFLTEGVSRAVNAENPTGAKGKGAMSSSVLGMGRKGSPCLKDIKSGETEVLADVKGAGVITHIWMTVTNQTTPANRYVLRDLVLRMYWDEEEEPSVEVPLGDFFCCGFGEECMVNSLPIVVLPQRGFNSYFKMPFRKRARITLENQHENTILEFFYQIDYCLYDELPDATKYFHARWNRNPCTEYGVDYEIANIIEGKGYYIGTYYAISSLERYWWGEGEVKFYIDGDQEYPTICGTGLEDYFGGSWSFANFDSGRMQETTFNSAYLGYPFYSKSDKYVTSPYHNDDVPPMRGLYRWHLEDPIFFQENLKVTSQQIGSYHGGLFERQDDISSVAYWYQSEPHKKYGELPESKKRRPR